MGWEERGSRLYYYRKEWVNGTCQTQYIGAGELAEAIAVLDELERQQQAFERDIERAEIEADQELVCGVNRMSVSGTESHDADCKKDSEHPPCGGPTTTPPAESGTVALPAPRR